MTFLSVQTKILYNECSHFSIVFHVLCFSACAVLDRMKPVSMTSFRDHVATKHEDRDKGFESEYQVWNYRDLAIMD